LSKSVRSTGSVILTGAAHGITTSQDLPRHPSSGLGRSSIAAQSGSSLRRQRGPKPLMSVRVRDTCAPVRFPMARRRPARTAGKVPDFGGQILQELTREGERAGELSGAVIGTLDRTVALGRRARERDGICTTDRGDIRTVFVRRQ